MNSVKIYYDKEGSQNSIIVNETIMKKLHSIENIRDYVPNVDINITNATTVDKTFSDYIDKKFKRELNISLKGDKTYARFFGYNSSYTLYNRVRDREIDLSNTTFKNIYVNTCIGCLGLNNVPYTPIQDFTYGFKEDYITPGNENFNPVTWLRANSHRYIAKMNSNNILQLKQLDDNDSSYYSDGTTAMDDLNSSDPNIDVFVKIPSFWYKVIPFNEIDSINEDYGFGLSISLTEPEDLTYWNYWNGNKLIGVFPGYVDTNAAYNERVISSKYNKSISNGPIKTHVKDYLNNKGQNYSLYDYDTLKMLYYLLIAFYGSPSAIACCGAGMRVNYTTGETIPYGMMDSVCLNKTQIDNAETTNPNRVFNDTIGVIWKNYNKIKYNYGNSVGNFQKPMSFWGIEEFTTPTSIDKVRILNSSTLKSLLTGEIPYYKSSNNTNIIIDSNSQYLDYANIVLFDNNNNVIRALGLEVPSGTGRVILKYDNYGNFTYSYNSKETNYSELKDTYHFGNRSSIASLFNNLNTDYVSTYSNISNFYNFNMLLHSASNSTKIRLMYEGPQEIVEDFDS